ncbi:MAG: hypothetical protein HFJ59_04100 [Clostridia bacterium]|nr:hypothetical protein [Clostridia bacterium]
MAYGVTYITTQGAILAAKTLQAKTLTFSKFQIGDGTIENSSMENIKALDDLVNKVVEFDITKISRETDTQITVRGLFKNTDAEDSFYLRELGLYAIDPDTNEEILFAYINYGDEAEYINNSISEKKENYYNMIIAVGNADNVTISTDESTVYVTERDLEEIKQKLANAGNKSEYLLKNDIKTFYIKLKVGNQNIEYPEGFNKNNTIVLKCMKKSGGNWITSEMDNAGDMHNVANIWLQDNNIFIQGEFEKEYKIVLMKSVEFDISDYELGDINKDGSITQEDINIVSNYLTGLGTLTEEQFKLADMNEDGMVDTADLLALSKKVNGIT